VQAHGGAVTSGLDEKLRQALGALVGPRWLRTEPRDLLAYSYDATGEKRLPAGVVFPGSIEEVSGCLALAADAGVPVVARGAGTNLSGGSLPVEGCLVVCLVRLDRVLEVDPVARLAVVECGATNEAVQKASAPHGLFYAPDPSSMKVATIGGGLAENAGGPRCAKYGVTLNHVVGVEAVLVDGSIVELGGSTEDAGGLDLLSPFVGSEGTLGIAVRATLRLVPAPRVRLTLLAGFSSLADSMAAASGIVAARVVPAALEFVESRLLGVIAQTSPGVFPHGAAAVLLIEVDGEPEETEAQAGRVAEVCRENGAYEVRLARDPAEAERLWAARRAGYGYLARVSRSVPTLDVTVPRDRLVEMMEKVSGLAQRHSLDLYAVAHAGDGNIHPAVPFDPSDPLSVERLEAFRWELQTACVELGGSITGEHGIGVEKLASMRTQYPDEVLALMAALRRSFDPLGLLNPGKVLPPRGGAS
jgi:glycolate oxidase